MAGQRDITSHPCLTGLDYRRGGEGEGEGEEERVRDEYGEDPRRLGGHHCACRKCRGIVGEVGGEGRQIGVRSLAGVSLSQPVNRYLLEEEQFIDNESRNSNENNQPRPSNFIELPREV